MACHKSMVVIIGRNRSNGPSRKSPRYVIRSVSEARKIAQYFARRGPPARGAGATRRRSEAAPVATKGGKPSAARASGGVMSVLGLLEDAGNDLLQRRLFHAQVGHGMPVENRGQYTRHPAARHLDVGPRPLPAHHLSEIPQV